MIHEHREQVFTTDGSDVVSKLCDRVKDLEAKSWRINRIYSLHDHQNPDAIPYYMIVADQDDGVPQCQSQMVAPCGKMLRCTQHAGHVKPVGQRSIEDIVEPHSAPYNSESTFGRELRWIDHNEMFFKHNPRLAPVDTCRH